MLEILSEYSEPARKHLGELDARAGSRQEPSIYVSIDAARKNWKNKFFLFSTVGYEYYEKTYQGIDDEMKSTIQAGLSALAIMDDGDY